MVRVLFERILQRYTQERVELLRDGNREHRYRRRASQPNDAGRNITLGSTSERASEREQRRLMAIEETL